MNNRLSQSGFTLLEIMIALAIFAVVSGTLIKNASQAVRQTYLIEQRTLAYWVAENHLEQMRSLARNEQNFPSTGTDRFNVTMAGTDWEIVVKVESTENEDMRRILVSVFREDDLDRNIVELTGFIGKF